MTREKAGRADGDPDECEKPPAAARGKRHRAAKRGESGDGQLDPLVLQGMFDQAKEAFLVADDQGKYLYANHAAGELLGMPPQHLIGKSISDFARPAGGAGAEGLWQTFLREGHQEGEIRLVRPDGSERTAEYRAQANVSPGYHLSILHDITQRKELEQQLEQQRVLLEATMERAAVGIALFDRDMRYVAVNAEYARMSGRSQESIEGHVIYDLDPYSKSRRALHERALAGEDVDERGVEFRSADGATSYYDISYRPVRDSDGQICWVVSSVTDVTDREELDQQKDEFIALASHELRNPITAIKGYSQLVLRRATKLGDEQLARQLGLIDEQAARLTALIAELMDVSRIQTGGLDLKLEPLDLGEAVTHAIRSVAPTMTGFSVSIDTGEGPYPVLADRRHIEGLLSNLLDNAVKYSGESKRIDVSVRRQGKNAVVAVRDYGLGIPAAEQGHVFSRFFRASNARGQRKGLGLGLYIASRTVSQHGGRMWLESAEGKGSTFYFSLPLVASSR